VLADHPVHGEPKLRPLAVTEPGDARGETLERNVLACKMLPIGDDAVVAEFFQQEVIDLANIAGVIRQGNPAEWPDRAREQRAQ
jgi:hypothetical protein